MEKNMMRECERLSCESPAITSDFMGIPVALCGRCARVMHGVVAAGAELLDDMDEANLKIRALSIAISDYYKESCFSVDDVSRPPPFENLLNDLLFRKTKAVRELICFIRLWIDAPDDEITKCEDEQSDAYAADIKRLNNRG